MLAKQLLAYRDLRFDEIRCNVRPLDGQDQAEALASMAEVVRQVHAA